MAPKKKTSSSKNLKFASPAQMKRPKQAHGKASFDEEEEEEEEDALEMERNFALFSKRGHVQKSVMTEKDEEETSDEESNEEIEDADKEENNNSVDFLKQREHAEREDDTDSGLHTKTGFNQDRSTMSFEEIMTFQSKVGTKACNKLIHESKKKKQKSEPDKRVSKDRPEEISAKKPVSFLRKLGSVKKPILRDPRFDDLSGDFKPEVFGQTYKFINDIRQREAEILQKKLKKVKSVEKKEELKSFMKRMENQKRNHQRREQQKEKERCFKQKQRALVGDGHRPFYLKKSDKKKLELAEKYLELKKSGKLENFLSKKRKRNAVKDRRKMP